MSWERDPLWAKSRLFIERAFQCSREEPEFGLWCSMALELLSRAAVASVSPTLLAAADSEHKHLLYVLGKGDPKDRPRSITASHVIRLCQKLFGEFTSEEAALALALFNRRNEELHTGGAAFEEYTTSQWMAGFYRCCQKLLTPLGETLETFMGGDEAKVAEELLAEVEQEVRQRVLSLIAERRGSYYKKTPDEQERLRTIAKEKVRELVFRKQHRVTCPACSAEAVVQGEVFGPARVMHDEEEGDIVVKQAVVPRSYECFACGLVLNKYSEVASAGLGDQYTRTTRYSPEEYFELIHPDDYESILDIADRHYRYREYDNE